MTLIRKVVNAFYYFLSGRLIFRAPLLSVFWFTESLSSSYMNIHNKWLKQMTSSVRIVGKWFIVGTISDVIKTPDGTHGLWISVLQTSSVPTIAYCVGLDKYLHVNGVIEYGSTVHRVQGAMKRERNRKFKICFANMWTLPWAKKPIFIWRSNIFRSNSYMYIYIHMYGCSFHEKSSSMTMTSPTQPPTRQPAPS